MTAGRPPEATDPAGSTSEVLLRYLDYYRCAAIAKVQGLDDETVRASVLPSGWTPLQLLKHLAAMEQRWLVWGFAGEPVPDPWYDRRDHAWWVDPTETVQTLAAALRDMGERTAAIVGGASLSDVGAPSDRWDGAPPPTLERVLLHVFQEYARHTGHLDIVRELIDGSTDSGA